MSWADIGKTIEAMKMGGKIVVGCLLDGADTHLSEFGIMQKNLSIMGIQAGAKSSFKAMNKTNEANNIKPVVDKKFNTHALPEALSYFEKGKHFGKVVLNF